jgi:hypothetical protein
MRRGLVLSMECVWECVATPGMTPECERECECDWEVEPDTEREGRGVNASSPVMGGSCWGAAEVDTGVVEGDAEEDDWSSLGLEGVWTRGDWLGEGTVDRGSGRTERKAFWKEPSLDVRGEVAALRLGCEGEEGAAGTQKEVTEPSSL